MNIDVARALTRSQDDVHAAIGLDDARHFAHAQRERRILKRLLHLSARELTEISPALVRTRTNRHTRQSMRQHIFLPRRSLRSLRRRSFARSPPHLGA